VSSDITHISSKIHQKIRSDTDLLLTLVKTLGADLARCKSQMNRLKVDVAQDLINVEIAQRTRDTPPALQYENTAPYDYFAQLISSFETQMIYYKRQIEETENYLQTMTTQGSLSIDDVTKAIARMQETFTVSKLNVYKVE
jgi:nucleoporin p58/p45